MADSNEPQTGQEVCNFFRKPSNKNKNIRKRTLDTTDGDAEAEEDPSQNPSSSILHKPKKTPKPTTNLHFSSTTTTSSENRPSQSEHKPSTGDDDDQPHSSSAVFHFESSSQIQVHNDSRATATLETETEFNRDARAIRERVLKQADESLKGQGKGRADEKVYRGMNAYTDYKAGFRREQTVAGEKAGGAHGPLRASAHIRSSMRFDYQPDICKDYKETGYCGFGDSCKFMHDRGDYKSGWQMEREWDEAEKVRKRNLALGGGEGEDGDGAAERGGGGGGRDADDDDDEDSLPFACFICRQPFQDPVVTKCKHYFCEHCALKHHSRNKKCYVCNKPTLGIFNTAHEIKKKMAEEK
ncbi:hypothetical protein AAC387_Pa10g0295 [Persea americana]